LHSTGPGTYPAPLNLSRKEPWNPLAILSI
jgi:hypothetical protein